MLFVWHSDILTAILFAEGSFFFFHCCQVPKTAFCIQCPILFAELLHALDAINGQIKRKTQAQFRHLSSNCLKTAYHLRFPTLGDFFTHLPTHIPQSGGKRDRYMNKHNSLVKQTKNKLPRNLIIE